jgi:hypothetical protein
MPAAERVERPIAVAVIIALKEPPLLMAMQGIVGSIEVQHDLARRLAVRLEEQVDEQPPAIAAPSWPIL